LQARAPAAAIAFVHAVLGPDHYLPFVAMAKARNWTMQKTLRVTLICGMGHLAASVSLISEFRKNLQHILYAHPGNRARKRRVPKPGNRNLRSTQARGDFRTVARKTAECPGGRPQQYNGGADRLYQVVIVAGQGHINLLHQSFRCDS